VREEKWKSWRKVELNDMSAGVVMCLISVLWLLVTFFPASAVARIGPGALASTETISYLERTPAVSNQAKHEVAELKSQSIEVCSTPQFP
jgi:hypothetical protein